MARHQRRGMNYSKRLTEWGATEEQPGLITIASGASAIFFAFDNRTSLLGEATIIRRRGLFSIQHSSASADSDVSGAIGTCIVNGEAFDAGVASVPTPVAEADDDRWFWHQYFSISNRFDSGPVQRGQANWVIDSKAMRKLSSSDVMITVMENTAVTFSAQVWLQARTLFKLH